MFKLGIVILAATFSAAGLRAQQQSPDQTNQDQQPSQNQQPAPNQTNQDQQQKQEQQQNQNQGAQQQPNPEQNQSEPDQPIPAYRSPLGGASNNEEDNNAPPQQYIRDTRPLSGLENVSYGTLREKRSNWSPYLSVLVSGQSGTLGATNPGWRSYESIVGGLNFEKISRVSDFDLRYVGSGSFYSNRGLGTTVAQDLNVSETLRWRRNSLTLVDQFGYFPEAAFGYGGAIGLPGLTTTTGVLQPIFLPGESILTAAGQRATNASLAQLDIGLSERSSFTIAGGYSFLRYFDNSLFDNADIIARAGYNYRMSPRNTIAVYYHFDQLGYSAQKATIENHTINVSYGRQLTGRLAFQVAAGPQISSYPISLIVVGGSTNSVTRVSWSMQTALTYRQQERSSLVLDYSHGVSGGSGIFLGADNDRVTGYLNRRLSFGTARLTAGYSHNKRLSAPGATSSGQTFSYWFGGATFAKPLSRTVSLSLGYELQYQQSNAVFCLTTPCGTSFTRNILSFGLNWKGPAMPF